MQAPSNVEDTGITVVSASVVSEERPLSALSASESDEASLSSADMLATHNTLVAALNNELRMATAVSETCLLPSRTKHSAVDLELALVLDNEMADRHMSVRGDDTEVAGNDSKYDESDGQDDDKYCGICFSPNPIGKFQCCLLVCDYCVGKHIMYSSAFGQRVYCPSGLCEREIPVSEWGPFLDEDTVNVLVKRQQERIIDQNPNARWCPNPKCAMPVFITQQADEGDLTGEAENGTAPTQHSRPSQNHNNKMCICVHCSTTFCRDCSGTWTRYHRLSCTGEDIAVRRWAIFKNTGRCPFCQGRIEKESGCNHMRCAQCGGEFCWLCKKPYEPEHYKSAGGCFGLQFLPVNLYGTSTPARIVRKSVVAVVAVGVGAAAVGIGAAVAVVGCVFYGTYVGTRHTYRVVKRKNADRSHHANGNPI